MSEFLYIFILTEEASGLLKNTLNKKRSSSDDKEDERTILVNSIPSSCNIRMENHGLHLTVMPSSLDSYLMEHGALEHNQEEPGQGAIDFFYRHYRGKAPISSE